ncbi:protein daughter of sevenless [Contarinia nasturtii]|uniref:protein daughter of sevenless n=1 Tax=Contarinia nasturtii TaxID=265458 RepID=UPI0012D3C3B1|nr:protein daughter of sevenless [Contarinia nasturtii]
MTKEIYHEGWLIKSPPTKRIWRARWRRRWFTLKQGEIPEQFCLEYYKDRSCRKLKGVIDLDQCEQVDSGLQLEHRKQKFQYMFDVKTPLRTYYLAANSEEDMNAWVNCICEVCNLQDLSKPQQQDTGDNRHYYNVTSEVSDSQGATNQSLMVNLKTTNLSPIKSSNASDQIALLHTAEPIDNNNSVYQNYDPKCRHSTYGNRETLICDAPLNKSGGHGPKEDYYNFTAIAKTSRNKNSDEPGLFRNLSANRKIPENLKLSSVSDLQPSQTSGSSGPYIAIADCISGSPTTPLNSLDSKSCDSRRINANIRLNVANEQPYSPKRNNIQTTPQTPQSGKSSPTDSESVFTDDEDWMPANPNDSTNGERCMRPSESSVENDSIVFTYAQRFSKLPDDESLSCKRGNSKRPLPVAGLLLEKTDSEEQNKEVNSSDTENASPAIAYGPKDINSYVDESYDIPRSHQLRYTKHKESNNYENSMDLCSGGTSASMLELDEGRSGDKVALNTEFMSSTMPKKRSHFYTNAAPVKVEGNVFRYDFHEQQPDAPAVDRKLKPKLNHDDNEPKVATPNMIKSVPSIVKLSPNKSNDLIPPCIDRKLKPSPTPIKLETSTLQRRGVMSAATDAEFQGAYNNDQVSKTLPRNYNNSSSSSLLSTATVSATMVTNPAPVSSPQCGGANSRQTGVLEYFDLDHSNPPPICNNSNTSASTSNLNSQPIGSAWSNNLSNRLSTVSISSSSVFGNQTNANDVNVGGNTLSITSIGVGVNNPPTSSGIVYKSVDFIKTEAFMRTRQDAEMARAKNRSKE